MLPNDSPFTNEANIKELPHKLDGSLGWLKKTPVHREWTIGEQQASELPSQLKSLIASAKEHGISLPDEFVRLISTQELHAHLRSVTGCYLDVAKSLLPVFDGYLFRFLSDQQDAVFWYIYANADASDHCVVSSYECYDADEMDYEVDDIEETDFYIWATSFEAFLSRF